MERQTKLSEFYNDKNKKKQNVFSKLLGSFKKSK